MNIDTAQNQKHKILIADDSEMNRAILADMLGEEYEILEAKNGVEAVAILGSRRMELSLLLLDIVMPEMDGFGVLEEMNRQGWIQELPVIMISSENQAASIERAYELGVTDFIGRPFDALIVHHRVVNTILLYAKQKKLIGMVAEQIYEKEEQSSLMVEILSHIVEFRNGESGLHVRHVHILTELFLRKLMEKTDRYRFSRGDIAVISTASALHDIGKIAIPESVLNKPGRLTDEEFDIMKTHTTIGAQMLRELPIHQNKPLVKVAYDICRWHHERYDGRGYPDGLAGDEIPISAQIVALADVYDALTSDRVYKKAIPHQEAVDMILGGQCGVFNPLLLECLSELSDTLPAKLEEGSRPKGKSDSLPAAEELLQREELGVSSRTLQLLEHERIKHDFFAALTNEIQFEYTTSPSVVTLSPFGATRLGFPEVIMDPHNDEKVRALVSLSDIQALTDILRSTSPGQPEVTYDCKLDLDGQQRWFRIASRAIWSSDDPPRYTGAIGKAIDIHDSRERLKDLEHLASSDALTGLLNHASARERIKTRLKERPEGNYALAIFDLDRFKEANDVYGHQFGDRVLVHTAGALRRSIRGGDIVARVGGDEFLIFLEYKTPLEPIIRRIFRSLSGQYEDFSISLSMGVAETSVVGSDYDALFRAADQALYAVKRGGRGEYRFYNATMQGILSAISPIDPEDTENQGGDAT